MWWLSSAIKRLSVKGKGMEQVKVERPDSLKRTASLSIALTPAEKQRIIDVAHGSGQVVSHMARQAILAEVAKLERAQSRKG